MKKIILFMGAVLISAVSFVQGQTKPTPAPAKPAAVAPQPPAPQVKPGMGEGKEKYPNLMEARKALENANAHLQKAPHDFGGHRAKAVEHINQALNEIKEAITWDEQHEKEGKGGKK